MSTLPQNDSAVNDPQEDEVRICLTCQKPYRRRTWGNGKRENLGLFRKSRFCCLRCNVTYPDRRHPKGPDAYQWKGDDAPPDTKRMRARRMYPLGECQSCQKPAVDRHHKDGNPGNNSPENIATLCRRCHMVADGRLEQCKLFLDARAKRLLATRQPKPCINCGTPVMVTRRGRCGACADWWYDHGGEERPPRRWKKPGESDG